MDSGRHTAGVCMHTATTYCVVLCIRFVCLVWYISAICLEPGCHICCSTVVAHIYIYIFGLDFYQLKVQRELHCVFALLH